jgi:hypothetical protein
MFTTTTGPKCCVCGTAATHAITIGSNKTQWYCGQHGAPSPPFHWSTAATTPEPWRPERGRDEYGAGD